MTLALDLLILFEFLKFLFEILAEIAKKFLLKTFQFKSETSLRNVCLKKIKFHDSGLTLFSLCCGMKKESELATLSMLREIEKFPRAS
jgi:hypothetical protein